MLQVAAICCNMFQLLDSYVSKKEGNEEMLPPPPPGANTISKNQSENWVAVLTLFDPIVLSS